MSESLKWVKARASGSSGGNCVEVGSTAAGAVAGVRDSKSPERGHLAVTPQRFAVFLASVKRGEYDLGRLAAARRVRGSGHDVGLTPNACPGIVAGHTVKGRTPVVVLGAFRYRSRMTERASRPASIPAPR